MPKLATPERILGFFRDPRVAWAAALLLAALTLLWLPADGAERGVPAVASAAPSAR